MSATTAVHEPHISPEPPIAFNPRLVAPAPAPVVPTAAELHHAVYGVSAQIYRRRRVAVGVALMVVGALVWTVVSLVAGVGESSVGADLARQPEPVVHIVQPGDTLWSIAAQIDTDGDVRDTVDRIADRNGGAALQVGQQLVID